MIYKVKFLSIESVITEIEAENEGDAYDKASLRFMDVEPEMEIIYD